MSRKTRMENGKRDKVTLLVMWEKRVEGRFNRVDRLGWYDCSRLLAVEWLQSEGLQPVVNHTEDCNAYTPVVFKQPHEIWA